LSLRQQRSTDPADRPPAPAACWQGPQHPLPALLELDCAYYILHFSCACRPLLLLAWASASDRNLAACVAARCAMLCPTRPIIALAAAPALQFPGQAP
jgi:hypothetical protein